MADKLKSPSQKGIKGILEPFCETGTEGIVWSLYDETHNTPDGKWTYEGLNCLEDGDFLKVFNDAACKKVAWQGEIKMKYPPETRFNRGIQEGVNEDAWAKLFSDAKPGMLYKKDIYAKMKAAAAKRREARQKKISDIVKSCHDGVDVTPMKPLRFKPRKPG